jgi:predicted dienelactone hydrolase
LLDAERTGLIGYSMGGYGAVITGGGGVTSEAVERGAPRGTLDMHLAGSDEHKSHFDERIKAIVAFAPWGMETGIWNAEGLAGMRTPTLFVAGSADDVSGYEQGVRAIWEQAVNIDRTLLTFEYANHNAAAPMPAPDESFDSADGQSPSFSHYADAVWDTVRMNNIAQHFATAYLGMHLKGDATLQRYLELLPRSSDGVWAMESDGTKKPGHTYWEGFQNRTAQSLRWETLEAAP